MYWHLLQTDIIINKFRFDECVKKCLRWTYVVGIKDDDSCLYNEEQFSSEFNSFLMKRDAGQKRLPRYASSLHISKGQKAYDATLIVP